MALPNVKKGDLIYYPMGDEFYKVCKSTVSYPIEVTSVRQGGEGRIQGPHKCVHMGNGVPAILRALTVKDLV